MERSLPPAERVFMTDFAHNQVQETLSSGEFITDPQYLNNVVDYLKTEDTLDPLQTLYALEASSPHLKTLMDTDIDLLRPCRLREHTEADLGGLETYLSRFTDPEHKQILRAASICKDIGKSLCAKATGNNLQQTAYNLAVTESLLEFVSPDAMAEDAKQAVKLLIEYDVIGMTLRGKFDQAKVDELHDLWPERFASQLADFVVTTHLSDSAAHTAHRQFTNAVGELQDCVTPEDVSLDFLFEPATPEQLVKLTQPYRRAVAALFPDAQAMADLLRPDQPIEEAPVREYPYTTEAEGIWSATLTALGQKFDTVKQQIEAFAMSTGFPISAFVSTGRGGVVSKIRIVRDPSRRFGTLPPEEHERAVAQLQALFDWERQPSEDQYPDVSACVGLLEGYNEETGTLHTPAEAIALLLEQGQGVSWRTEPTTLISARRVLNEKKHYELQDWSEKVLHVTGTNKDASATGNPALDRVSKLSGTFNQQRFFAEDGASRKTIARTS